MAERFNAPVLKTGEGATPPRVRISLSPPLSSFRALVLCSDPDSLTHTFSERDGHPDVRTLSEKVCVRESGSGQNERAKGRKRRRRSTAQIWRFVGSLDLRHSTIEACYPRSG